jgi:2-polyprenyl-3-methyl-5-hydroxy-6-metoxy-1,4-benzoquinol methylase
MDLKAEQVKEFYGKYPFPGDNIKDYKDLLIWSWALNSIPESLFPGKDSKIADMGCGTGEFSCFLSRLGNVKGFDFSSASIKKAKLLAKNLNCDVNFVENDITKEEDRGKFDYIFSIGVMHHIPEVDKALENIKKMMDSNSLFIISVYSKWSRTLQFRKKSKEEVNNMSRYMDEYHHPFEKLMSRGQFKSFLEERGFEIVGEWRKMPDFVRFLTGKGGMMTFCVRLKETFS